MHDAAIYAFDAASALVTKNIFTSAFYADADLRACYARSVRKRRRKGEMREVRRQKQVQHYACASVKRCHARNEVWRVRGAILSKICSAQRTSAQDPIVRV